MKVNYYDESGREAVKYQPFESAGNDGNYKNNPVGELAAYYALQQPGEQYYFSRADIKASPLNRTIKAMPEEQQLGRQ